MTDWFAWGLGLLLLCLLGLCSVAYRTGAPEDLGCESVRVMNGWRTCATKDHHVLMVGIRGCGEHDGHAYEVEGTNAAGLPAQALVCCGTFLKSCTVRAR